MLLKDDDGNIKECMHFVHNFNCFHLSVPMGCKVRMAYSTLTLVRLLNWNEFIVSVVLFTSFGCRNS